ncbi:MAG TPA: tetratricopeptide repeat protein [Rubricoccaceae bacterium]|nr:tetratricopeptide repeat protein [Rubricoccaceae bacterium]
MRGLLVLLFALRFAGPFGVLAIPAAGAQPTVPGRPGLADTTSTAGRFQLAERYLQAGQTDRAIALLEDLHAAEPNAPAVVAKLREAYAAGRRFDDLVRLAEEQLRRSGPSPSLLAERGAALYQAGRGEEAERAWADAMALAPQAELTYRVVSTAIGQVRLYDRAADVLRAGRTTLGDSTLFRAEVAHLFVLAGDPARAIEEYLADLAQRPDALPSVQARLVRLLEQEGAAEILAVAVERAVRRDPLNRAYRELSAWLALERRDYRAALDAHTAIDRLEGEQGQSLFSFAEAAVAAGALEEAERAYVLILERHPNGPMAPLALFGRAALAQRRAEAAGETAFDAQGQPLPTPLYDAALAGFRTFAEEHAHLPQAAGALRHAAEIERTVFRRHAEAETLLQQIAGRSGDPGADARARLDLGALAVQRGDLAAARAAYAHVEETLRIGPFAEEARFELALLDFYAGDFASALARVEAMNENTATNVANDAIALKVMLREHEGPDSTSTSLRAYARAALLHRQGRPAESLTALDSLLAVAAQHPVADEAAFLRAQALRTLGRPQEALADLAAFPERYPLSYLVERAAFLRGELFETALNDPAAAVQAYTDLLARFPGSLLAAEARARIRRLRGDRPPG